MKHDMAVPVHVDEGSLDLTAYEWIKVAAGAVIGLVAIAAMLILLSLSGPA